ncbi:hypothetical protein GE09DRAFT_311158 [Coniochaeta sp. 2T2.1]|nr:hypothetical protein GE09DRAFT_311158 [Coniochaeta sp. 2T2.1]
MQQLLNAQAPHRAPAPGPLDCLRNYPELLLHPMTPETHPYLPVTQAISGWLAVEQLLQLDFWEDQWCFQEATMSSSRCLFFIGAGRALLNENTVKAGYEALEKILRLFRTTPRRPDFIPERDWRLLRAQYSKMKIPYLVQRFIAAKEQMVSAKERGCSTDKWVQRDARAQRAVLCVKLGFTHLAECSDRGDYYYSLGAIAGFKLHEFDVDYEGRPMVDICLLFWDAYLAATRDTPDALLFLHDALGPFGRREYDLPSWCPAYHHVEHQRLNREPFRRLRSRSWGATALGPECNLLNRYVPDSGSPLVHLRDQYLKVYGFVLGEVVGRSWRIGKNAVRNGLFRRYLLDYARRHGVYSREALPGGEAHRAAAKDLFATLMRDLDGEFEHQKGLDWLNIFEEGATFNQEDEKLWAEIRKAYAKALRRLSGIPLVRYLEAPPPRDVVKANLQKFLEDFSNTSRTCFFDTNGGIIGLGPEDMRVGDIACLIQGIQCPVILRPGMPIPKDPRPTWFPAPFAAVTRSRSLPPPDDGCGKGGFQFVGTCFLSGLMRGEAGARKPEHVKRHEEEFRGFRVY